MRKLFGQLNLMQASNGRYSRSNQKLGEEKINRREKPRRTEIQKQKEEQKQIQEMRQDPEKLSRIRGEDSNKDLRFPKLVTSQFNGMHIDYFRFSNQFET